MIAWVIFKEIKAEIPKKKAPKDIPKRHWLRFVQGIAPQIIQKKNKWIREGFSLGNPKLIAKEIFKVACWTNFQMYYPGNSQRILEEFPAGIFEKEILEKSGNSWIIVSWYCRRNKSFINYQISTGIT